MRERTPRYGHTRNASGAAYRYASTLLSVLIGLWLTACDGFLADPAPVDRASFALELVTAGSAGGASAAFDKANAIWIRVTSGSDVRLETTIPVTPGGGDIQFGVEVPLNETEESVTIQVEVRLGAAALFRGSTNARLSVGVGAPVALTLSPVAGSITVAPVPTITALGETAQIRAAAIFATGDTVPDVPLQYQSNNTAILTVDPNGLMTAVTEGQAQVTVRTQGANSIQTSAAVTVRATIASIQLAPPTATVNLNGTVQFTATARDRRNNVLARTFTWASSAPTIASVNANTGLVTGLATGTSNITAASEGTTSPAAVVTVLSQPHIALSRDSATFTMLAGDANPPQQTINVTNSGGGTLAGLALGAVQYGAGQPTGWLAATLTGSTAPATITLQAVRGNLAPGTYTATVPVVSSNADNSPRNLTVTFVITPTFTLTVSGTGTGSGTVTGSGISCTINRGVSSGVCSARYVGGAQVTLTASPTPGTPSSFAGWSGSCTGTSTCTLVMSANRQVSATFSLPTARPVISGLSATQTYLPTTVCTAAFPFLIEFSFSFTDADGNLPADPPVAVSWVFTPSGNNGTYTAGGTRTGNDFSGTIRFGPPVCWAYNDDQRLSVTVTVTDLTGLVSNPINVILSKPIIITGVDPSGVSSETAGRAATPISPLSKPRAGGGAVLVRPPTN